MGLDSGDDAVLRLLKGNKHSMASNVEACRLYTDYGIEIYTSFVLIGLGLDKRTRAALDATVEFADWLASETSTVSFDSSAMYPDKKAPIGGLIWFPNEAPRVCAALGWDFLDLKKLAQVSAKWREEVYLDPLPLCADFLEVCGTTFDVVQEYSRQIEYISTNAQLNFGRSQSGET